MRVVFAGTPDFAKTALDAILDAGYQVPLVLTQPDRPAGRGMRLTPSPVKQRAEKAGIPVCQPRSLRLDGKFPADADAAREALLAARPDVMVVAAYGLILPEWTLTLPVHGCLNIHASLLPRWRGAAPIHRAIQAGDAETGITIMQMDEGLDTGDIVLVRSLPITPRHTSASLHDDLAALGARSIVEALVQLEREGVSSTPQPQEGVTYADKLSRAEAALDFSRPASELERCIRAFNPFPGATMALDGIDGVVKIWQARVLDHHDGSDAAAAGASGQPQPGDVIHISQDGIDVMTGNGVLRLLELQRPGGRRQPVSAFVQGWSA